MRTQTLIVSLAALLSLLGCSKQAKLPRQVPATVAELEASPDFKLEHTTKSGIKCYVRYLTPEVADAIDEDNPDFPFLLFSGGEVEKPFLVAVVYKDRVVACDAKDSGLVSGDEYTAEGLEVAEFARAKLMAAQAAELSRMMQELGR